MVNSKRVQLLDISVMIVRLVMLFMVVPAVTLMSMAFSAHAEVTTDEQRCEWYYQGAQRNIHDGALFRYDDLSANECTHFSDELIDQTAQFRSSVLSVFASHNITDPDELLIANHLRRMSDALPRNSLARSFIMNTAVIILNWAAACREQNIRDPFTGEIVEIL